MSDLSHIPDSVIRRMAEAARRDVESATLDLEIATRRAERYELEIQSRPAPADAVDPGSDEGQPVPVHHVPQNIADVNRSILRIVGYDAHLTHAPSSVAGVL